MTTSRNLIMARALLDQCIEEMGNDDSPTIVHHHEIMRILPALASSLQVRLFLGLVLADGAVVPDGRCHALMDGAEAPYPEPVDGWGESDRARLRMATRRIEKALIPLGLSGCLVRHRAEGYAWNWGRAVKR